MKKRKLSKIFIWMFFLPVVLWSLFVLISFLLDNTILPEEKLVLGKLTMLFSILWIIPWFIICLIISALINYLKEKHIKINKNKLFIAIGIILSVFLIFYFWYIDYWRIIKINWEISIPYMSFYNETYHKDSGPSFLGDGTRYHVFSYKNEKYIEKAFAWQTEEKKTKYNDSYSEFIKEQLSSIGVLEKDRPDYSKCSYWYNNYAGNEIVICWNKDENKLYVIENLM